jgi:HK97 family phage portal protein
MAGILTSFSEAIKAASFVYGKTRGAASGFPWGWGRFDNLTDPYPRWQYNGKQGDAFDVTASAGNPADNSAVVICLGKIANVFPEPRLQVVELDSDGNWQPVEDHPALDLLSEPNQLDDFGSLSIAWAMSYKVDGNAYFVLTRTRGGEIAQIDYVRPDQMRPESNSPTVAIQRYIYTVDGKETPYDPSDVIHWRDGKDPNDPRLGLGRLKRLLGEIATDNEATRYTTAILHNMGIVGGMLVSDDAEAMPADKEQVERLRAHWKQQTTGSNRGGLIIPTWKAKYQDIGRSPEEMALRDIRTIPEARIAAVLDVPAMVAGLTAGSESKSYANYAEARESFWEECIVPLHTRFCAGLTRYLLPQYGDEIRGNRRRRFRYCYDEVRAFQPDMDKVSGRKTKEWMADGITLNEYREAVGEKEWEEEAVGKLFYSQHTSAMKPSLPDPAAPPESQGDLAATADNAVGRTMPFGTEKKALAGLNGHAAKAVEFEADGVEYTTTSVDVMKVAADAFGDDLEDFWAKRRERWSGLLEEGGGDESP